MAYLLNGKYPKEIFFKSYLSKHGNQNHLGEELLNLISHMFSEFTYFVQRCRHRIHLCVLLCKLTALFYAAQLRYLTKFQMCNILLAKHSYYTTTNTTTFMLLK